MIEWLGVDGESEQPVVTSNDQATLDLVFNPVREGLDGGTFRCRVTIGGATVDQDVTVTVQGELFHTYFLLFVTPCTPVFGPYQLNYR